MRIRLSPEEPPEARHSHMPTPRARRWTAPWEDDGPAPAVAVFMTAQAYERCCAHAGSDLEHEVGGGLVGKWRFDARAGRHFVVVEAVVPARHTRQGSTFLTFTQDSLVALHAELDERYPGRRFVGWYHTHPRMGVFLSGYDAWLHEHFFPHAWQVALVVEPHTPAGGFFVRGPDGRLDRQRYFGFYELLRQSGTSVVAWANLASDAAPPPGAGG